ncbi:hypothetical protein KIPB_007885 [Kipferlia bialata]|uniref:Uncharacterized protein n=1 Tax=Kipferlia bialata TaxID=797122 RepID=A0A9K3GJF5_9EUKA|nr:hypothetical protein KIPB_007885 [Kipferlia bialata]|eukprot:g7885.t1
MHSVWCLMAYSRSDLSYDYSAEQLLSELHHGNALKKVDIGPAKYSPTLSVSSGVQPSSSPEQDFRSVNAWQPSAYATLTERKRAETHTHECPVLSLPSGQPGVVSQESVSDGSGWGTQLLGAIDRIKESLPSAAKHTEPPAALAAFLEAAEALQRELDT